MRRRYNERDKSQRTNSERNPSSAGRKFRTRRGGGGQRGASKRFRLPAIALDPSRRRQHGSAGTKFNQKVPCVCLRRVPWSGKGAVLLIVYGVSFRVRFSVATSPRRSQLYDNIILYVIWWINSCEEQSLSRILMLWALSSPNSVQPYGYDKNKAAATGTTRIEVGGWKRLLRLPLRSSSFLFRRIVADLKKISFLC